MKEGRRSVTEGGMVMVCATLTGQLAMGISVVVGLTSTIGTGKSCMILKITMQILINDNYVQLLQRISL